MTEYLLEDMRNCLGFHKDSDDENKNPALCTHFMQPNKCQFFTSGVCDYALEIKHAE